MALGKKVYKTNVESLFQPARPGRKNAHVIVCGNEKGGSGKTTTTMHLAVALLKRGFRVATIDLDVRQRSLTRYIENRAVWSDDNGLRLEMPDHFRFDAAEFDSALEAQMKDFSSFVKAVARIEATHDFLLIDTPGHDNYLMQLAHSMADTLITPMNDSFVDFDVLARVDARSNEVTEVSQYAEMVRKARRKRRDTDDGLLDWIVVRNRLSSLSSHNEQSVFGCINDLSLQLGFRIANGISERVVFRQYFPRGLTALDEDVLNGPGERENPSHVAARKEICNLLGALRLPIDDHARQRAVAREMWIAKSAKPLEMPDIFAD